MVWSAFLRWLTASTHREVRRKRLSARGGARRHAYAHARVMEVRPAAIVEVVLNALRLIPINDATRHVEVVDPPPPVDPPVDPPRPVVPPPTVEPPAAAQPTPGRTESPRPTTASVDQEPTNLPTAPTGAAVVPAIPTSGSGRPRRRSDGPGHTVLDRPHVDLRARGRGGAAPAPAVPREPLIGSRRISRAARSFYALSPVTRPLTCERDRPAPNRSRDRAASGRRPWPR